MIQTIIFFTTPVLILVLLGILYKKNTSLRKQYVEAFEIKDEIEAKYNTSIEDLEKAYRDIKSMRFQLNRLDYLLGRSKPLDLTEKIKSGRTFRLSVYYIDLMFRAENHEVKIDLLKPCSTCQEATLRNHLINSIKKLTHFYFGLKINVKDGGKVLQLKGKNDKFMKAQNKAVDLGLVKKGEKYEGFKD